MKKLLFVITGLLWAALTVFPARVVAANIAKPVIESQNSPTKTDEVTDAVVSDDKVTLKKSEYTLQYPGILPDHPLYFLKQLRDRIMESLISDPLRKIEFYLLQGDKLTNSGIFLNAKNKDVLAIDTFSRALTNMEKAIKEINVLVGQGKVIPGYIIDRFMNVLTKQEEVLSELAGNSTGSQKDNYSRLLDTVKRLGL